MFFLLFWCLLFLNVLLLALLALLLLLLLLRGVLMALAGFDWLDFCMIGRFTLEVDDVFVGKIERRGVVWCVVGLFTRFAEFACCITDFLWGCLHELISWVLFSFLSGKFYFLLLTTIGNVPFTSYHLNIKIFPFIHTSKHQFKCLTCVCSKLYNFWINPKHFFISKAFFRPSFTLLTPPCKCSANNPLKTGKISKESSILKPSPLL